MGERTTTRDRNTGGRAGHIRLCDRRLTSRLPAAAPCRRRPLCLGRHPRDKERALVRPEIRERTHAVDLTMNLTIGPAVEVDPVVHSPLLPEVPLLYLCRRLARAKKRTTSAPRGARSAGDSVERISSLG